jgi:hypothetical protein
VRVRSDQIEVRCLGGTISVGSVRLADGEDITLSEQKVLAQDEILTIRTNT